MLTCKLCSLVSVILNLGLGVRSQFFFFPVLHTVYSQNIFPILTETFTCPFIFWLPEGFVMSKDGRCQPASLALNTSGSLPRWLRELGGSDRFLDSCFLQLILAELFWRDYSFFSPSYQDSDGAVPSSAATEYRKQN